jgi:hypothetical protein
MPRHDSDGGRKSTATNRKRPRQGNDDEDMDSGTGEAMQRKRPREVLSGDVLFVHSTHKSHSPMIVPSLVH